MDEAVNPMRAALAVAVLLAGTPAAPLHAQELQDPTRPPARMERHAGSGSITPSGAPQLQSVLIARGSGGRQVAVIDGETVRLGERFHGARLVRMTQDEVELARGGERQVLKLYAPAGAAAAAMAVAAPAATAATAAPVAAQAATP